MGSVSLTLPFVDRWYFAEIERGARTRTEEAGHRLSLHVIPPGPDSTAAAVDALEEDFGAHDSIGGIVAGIKYRKEVVQRALRWHRPVVVVGGSVMGFPTVMIDDLGAAREATQHLRSLGHRRILHLAGLLEDQMDFSVHGRRAKGYRQVMEAAGLDPLVVETEFDFDAAYRVAHTELGRQFRPSAIFAVSDEIAFAALAAARDLGLKPGWDVSIIGIDDHEDAERHGLTTIRQRPAEMGATAVDMLLAGLEHGPDPSQSRLAQIHLVERSSTGPCTMSDARHAVS